MALQVPRPLNVYLMTVATTGSLLVASYLLVPALRPYLANEGGVVENLSATFYFYSVIVGFSMCRRAVRFQVAKRYVAVPMLGLLCFADEVLNGPMVWGDAIPVWYGVELNSPHELLHVGYNLLRDHGDGQVNVTLIAVAMFLLGMWSLKYMTKHPRLLELLKSDISYQLVMIGVVLGCVALGLDRDPGHTLTFYEEWLEMNAALALLFAAALISESNDRLSRLTIRGLPTSLTFQMIFLISVAIAVYCGVLWGGAPLTPKI